MNLCKRVSERLEVSKIYLGMAGRFGRGVGGDDVSGSDRPHLHVCENEQQQDQGSGRFADTLESREDRGNNGDQPQQLPWRNMSDACSLGFLNELGIAHDVHSMNTSTILANKKKGGRRPPPQRSK